MLIRDLKRSALTTIAWPALFVVGASLVATALLQARAPTRVPAPDVRNNPTVQREREEQQARRDLAREREAARQKLLEIQAAGDERKRELEAARAQAEHASQAVAATEAVHAQTEHERDARRSQVRVTQTQVDQAQHSLDEARTQLSRLSERRDATQQAVAKVNDRLVESTTRLTRLEAQVREAQHPKPAASVPRSAERTHRKKKKKGSRDKSATDHPTPMRSMASPSPAPEASAGERASALQQLEHKQSAQQQELVAKQRELSALRQSVRDSQSQFDRLTAQEQRLTSRLEHQRASLAAADRAANIVAERLSTRRGEASRAQDQVLALAKREEAPELIIARRLRDARPAEVRYARPETLVAGQWSDLWLKLTLEGEASPPSAASHTEKTGEGHAHFDAITPELQVTLDAAPDEFEVESKDASARQYVAPGKTGVWNWRVKPKRPGRDLTLSYLVTVVAEGSDLTVPQEPRVIHVRVDAVPALELTWYERAIALVHTAVDEQLGKLASGAVTLSFGMVLSPLRSLLLVGFRRVLRDRRKRRRHKLKGTVGLRTSAAATGAGGDTVAVELCDINEDHSGLAVRARWGVPEVAPGTLLELSASDLTLSGTATNIKLGDGHMRIGIALDHASRDQLAKHPAWFDAR